MRTAVQREMNPGAYQVSSHRDSWVVAGSAGCAGCAGFAGFAGFAADAGFAGAAIQTAAGPGAETP